MKKITIYFIFICSCGHSYAGDINWEVKELNNSKINNILALSDCYGYVRYFYPNPQIEDFDWTKFLMYSIQKIDKVNDDEELKDILLKLFKPLCSQIYFSTDTIINVKTISFPYYAMAHKAIGSLTEMTLGKNYSPIVQVVKDLTYKDSDCFRLKENLYVNFPMAIKELPNQTDDLRKLQKEVSDVDMGHVSLVTALINKKKVAKNNLLYKRLSHRIADVIIRRNIVQHFYPYFKEDELGNSWDSIWAGALLRIGMVNNLQDYYLEINRMMSPIKDSHLYIWNSFNVGRVGVSATFYYPDVSYEFVNDTCMITTAGKEYREQMSTGDILLYINGKLASELVNEKMTYSSWTTKNAGLHNLAVLNKLFESSTKDSIIQATLMKKDKQVYDINLKANLSEISFYPKPTYCQRFDNDLFYLNLCSDSCTYENFVKHIPNLKSSKGIVFDVRGRPNNDVLSIISHFIKETMELGNLFQPNIRYPNQINVDYALVDKWFVAPAISSQSDEISKKNGYKKPYPIYIEKPIVFLINEKTKSFGETFIDMIKYYNIGTLLGTPTAGCNGDATRISMLSATFFMTFNKFLNRDGSQYHGVGILPDIYCENFVIDKQHNIDTQLKKAKQILTRNGKINNNP